MPGSLMWGMIEKRIKENHSKRYDDLFRTDDPDLEEIRQIWIKEMCPDLVKESGSLTRTMEWLRNEAEAICKLSSSKIISRIE